MAPSASTAAPPRPLAIALLLLAAAAALPALALVDMRPGPRDRPTFAVSSDISSVTCWGEHSDDRVCHFRNFCFDHEGERFVMFPGSAESVARWAEQLPNPPATLHSKQGLWPMFLQYEEGDFPEGEPGVHVIDDFAVVQRQYVEGNTYHTISEDFLPGFHLASFFAPEIAAHYGDENGDFEVVEDAIDKRAKFVFLDWIYQGDYSRSKAMFLWTLLSDKPLAWGGLHWERDRSEFGDKRTCFRSAAIAAPRLPRSQDDGWHGPPQIHPWADGLLTRIAVDFILRQLELPATTFSSLKPVPRVVPDRDIQLVDRQELEEFQAASKASREEDKCIVTLVSRKRTRVILNEEELLGALRRTEGVDDVWVVNEDGMTGEDIIALMRGSQVLIGMHGAGLSWGIFLPYNATVIELASYGSQPEYFTYFRSMFTIPDIGVDYQIWQNNNASFAHGPRGGLVEEWGILSKSNEEIIDCLTMPIKRHPYAWGSHCLNYWRDHDNGVAVTEIADVVRQACA